MLEPFQILHCLALHAASSAVMALRDSEVVPYILMRLPLPFCPPVPREPSTFNAVGKSCLQQIRFMNLIHLKQISNADNQR